MSSDNEAIHHSQRRALARRFFARVLFSLLVGLNVPVSNIVIDIPLWSSMAVSTHVGRAVGYMIFVVIVNSVSIGIVTYTSQLSKRAVPPWWALPVSLGVLAGLLLVGGRFVGISRLYNNAIEAFVVGVVAGVAVGGAYTLSIPGIRQDTILKQSKRSIVIGVVVGIQYGVYFLIKELPQIEAGMQFYYMVAAFIGVPITIVGLLLSFVLGIELGDRYVER